MFIKLTDLICVQSQDIWKVEGAHDSAGNPYVSVYLKGQDTIIYRITGDLVAEITRIQKLVNNLVPPGQFGNVGCAPNR